METRKMKLALSAGALALSLALAGCGGGSGTVAQDPPPPSSAELAASQTTAATNAIEAAKMAVGALDIESTEMALTDAQGLIKAVEDAIAAAANVDLATRQEWTLTLGGLQADLDMAEAYATAGMAIADAEDADAADAALTAAKENVSGEQFADLQMKVAARKADLEQMAAVDRQEMALETAAGMIDTSDLSTSEAIDTANAAIEALRKAIEEATAVDDKSMYEMQVEAAEKAVNRANHMMALSSASEELQSALTALAGRTPTQAQINDANTALAGLTTAIENAKEDLTDEERTSSQTLADSAPALIGAAQTALNSAIEEDDKATRAEMAAAGKALYGKLNYNPTMVPVMVSAGKISIGNNTTAVGGDAGDCASQACNGSALAKTKDEVMPLNGWMGADYMKSAGSGNDKVTHMARVYSNPDAPKSTLFTDQSNPSRLTYVPDDKNYQVGPSHASDIIMTGLPSSGTQDFANGASIEGSYMGATGTYKCVDASCMATPITAGGVTLSNNNWRFVPDANASIEMPDSAYLQFGWWVRKDRDGATHASAFYGQIPVADTQGALTHSDGSSLTGTAKYMGKAAGKFAINNPLGDDSDGGHFTANAMLEAQFGATTDTDKNGLTGTIDGFMLNDGNVAQDWSVKLNRARWNSTKYELTTGGGHADSTTDHIIDGTAVEWSIGDDVHPGQTGQWEAQLFDENTKDKNTSPTTVIGRFEAGFGDTHKMVGAFGANQEK